MVDFGSEQHFWRHHWVLIREEKFCFEQSSVVRGIGRAGDLNVEMYEIGLIRSSINAHD